MNDSTDQEKPVLFFDGVCNLCHRAVRWTLKRDPRGVFRFASLQSDSARRLLAANLTISDPPTSIILLADGRVWQKSDVWLEIMRRLGGGWSVLASLRILPRPFRDCIYDFIARRRYRWFGKLERCPLPDPRFKNRFLD